MSWGWKLYMIMCEVRDSGIGHADRPWEPIPNINEDGDILLSTQIMSVGKSLEDANEIDQMITDGLNIYGVAVATMEEMIGQPEKVKLLRERLPKHRLHYNSLTDLAAYKGGFAAGIQAAQLGMCGCR